MEKNLGDAVVDTSLFIVNSSNALDSHNYVCKGGGIVGNYLECIFNFNAREGLISMTFLLPIQFSMHCVSNRVFASL